LVKWNDFLAHGLAARGDPLDFTRAKLVPCLAAEGQCFDLPVEVPGQASPADFVLVDADAGERGEAKCAR
jgi:hypothetical protein